ncbi:sodium:solute symporter family protein, partial [Oscillospiraceae bacterium OttesenSCG-928-F05]|nr:sodium:solute symporter family protein [Oscillospiraceae bacterium OttesenSCG-928-F05]
MDIWIVIGFLGALIAFGLWHGRGVHTIDDFSLPARKVGFFTLVCALTAGAIGGGFSSGNAAEVFQSGVGNILILSGFSLGQILMGRLFLPRVRPLEGVSSPGELMRSAYGKPGQVITGLASALLCGGVIGAQISAIGAVFNVLLDIPFAMGVLIGLFVLLVYATAGGIGAVITAEVVECLLLLAGMPLLLFFSLRHIGGVEALVREVPPEFWNVFNGRGPVALISLFLTMIIGEALMPSTIQRFLSGKDRKTIAGATVASGVITLPLFIITGLVGLCALVDNPAGEPALAMASMILKALPVGVKGVVVTAVLAIAMSSADAVLSCASIGIVNDVLRPLGALRSGRAG